MQNLNQNELAKRWDLSPRTLERWRTKGLGPKFLKVGARCIYPLREVESFEATRLRQSTKYRAQGN